MAFALRKKKPARVMTVSAAERLTPNMVRVTLTADFIGSLSAGIEGAHCKLFLPEPGQGEASFRAQLDDGPRPTVRTYTIRYIRPALSEMDIDFVDHGDAGPASAWARRAVPGQFCGFAGPGPVKLSSFFADYYVVAADMSALPVAAATLEAMPRDAKGIAVFEVTCADDRQPISAPPGIEQHWIVHAEPHHASDRAVEMIRNLPAFQGKVQTCIAGESSVIKALRAEIMQNRAVPKANAYISGYWKIGLVEDEHQQAKRSEAAA
ncbi:MAG: siderophore-interacting protein [Pseudomonadota bacterium]